MKYRFMKEYDTDDAISAIDKQIAKKKEEAIRIMNENDLDLVQKMMEANPTGYYFVEEFEKKSFLITSLKINQIMAVLGIENLCEEEVFYFEAAINYTQLMFAKKEILRLKREFDSSCANTTILISEFESIDDLTPITDERYYFEPIYVKAFFKDEDEEVLYRICPETYSFHVRQEDE